MDFFEVLAECSIAFAGFAAVHAAISGGAGPRGSFRAWTTVASGVLVFLAALLPILLATHLSTDAALWRTASGIALVGLVLYASSIIVIDRKLAALGHLAQVPLALRGAQTLQFTGSALVLMNLLRGEPGSTVYAVALVLVLVSGMMGLLMSFWLDVSTVAPKEPEGD